MGEVVSSWIKDQERTEAKCALPGFQYFCCDGLQVCVKYLHEKCDQDKCNWLHMCGYFMRGECYRRTCYKSHNLLEESTNLLIKSFGIPAVSVENFQMLAVLKNIQLLQTQGEQTGRGRGRGASSSRGGGRGRKHVHIHKGMIK
ncbi:Hypothetical predicted protein [Pelobates cultripes]|uniref:C3H1-type domain-containing protein n=1 Tax=Pelobates cultripes TaxID=61616 RepID=A0AAD1VWW3_PELCU|nr:Hypothetical predicted protein [Pelobates cultripes]